MKINSIRESLTFSVPLSREARERAQARFRQTHLMSERSKQVYLNTLSTYAVEYYLECMGFKIDRGGSDQNSRVMREFADVADVAIQSVGQFECRPVLPGDRAVRIPLEAQCDRRGYFAVQLNRQLTHAQIIGFLKHVSAEEVPLEQWQSLDDFLRYASHLERAVNLTQWLHNAIDAGWETLESVLSTPKMVWRRGTADNWRSAVSTDSIERVKRLTVSRSGEEIALLVRLWAKTQSEMGIGVEVYPTGDRTYLPQELKLMVLDEDDNPVMQAEARSTKNIQLKFSGTTGEAFSVRVALGETSVTEAFTI